MECQEKLQETSGIAAMARSAATGEEHRKPQHSAGRKTNSLFERILRKIFPDERKNERHPEPPLVGHLGMAHNSKPYKVADISVSGFSLLTGECWEPGTEMPITLRRTDPSEGNEPESFTVQATVVRSGARKVGFSIALAEGDSQAVCGNPLHVRWITRVEMQDFLSRMKEPLADQSKADQVKAVEETRVSTAVQGKPGLKAAFEGGD